MISRDKTILINKLSGILKVLSINGDRWYLDLDDCECNLYIDKILSHNELEPISDWCKKKNVKWEIRNYTGGNDWKLILKIWK